MAPPLRLNQTAQQFRPTRTPNGAGGWTTSLVPVGQVRCRVRSWTTEEELIARQQGVRVSHIMYIDAGTDVRRDDVFEIGSWSAAVQSVRTPSTRHHLMVDLEERQT